MEETVEENKHKAANRLAAARVLATEYQPYLSKTLFAMVPVPTEGFGTFAVDKRWRMYYDPAACLKWTTEEIAAVWLHEAGHLIRDHANRFENYSEPQYMKEWNQSADAAINSDLRGEGIMLPDPDNRFYAEPNPYYPNWGAGMTTEEMYEQTKGGQGEEDSKGTGKSDLEQESGEKDNTEKQYYDFSPSKDEEEDEEKELQETNDKDSENQEDSEDRKGLGSENQEDSDSEDSEDSEGQEDSDSEDSDSEDSNSEGQEDSEDQEGSSQGEEEEGNQSGTGDSDTDDEAGQQSGAQEAQNAPSTAHDCGSGASGGERDYEEPADADDGSLDPDEAELVRQETAQDIMDHARSGSVPAGMIREADDLLNPQVDWRTELMSTVRRTCATVAGAKDYTYSRPSRRSSMTSFYLPAMRAPRPPEIIIVLDTSGSMSPKDLGIALSEIQSIVERSSSGSARSGLKVVSCDAGAKEVETVRSVEDIKIVGGGGTDMRVGIKRASEHRPKPDAIITITDGGTPWPKEPYQRNIAYINVIINQSEKVNTKRSKQSSSSLPPEWMHSIYVYRNPSKMSI